MDKNKYQVPVIWAMQSLVSVCADSLEDAIKKVKEDLCFGELPTDGKYVENSIEIGEDEDVREIMALYNEDYASELICYDYNHWSAAVEHGILVTADLLLFSDGVMVTDAKDRTVLGVFYTETVISMPNDQTKMINEKSLNRICLYCGDRPIAFVSKEMF